MSITIYYDVSANIWLTQIQHECVLTADGWMSSARHNFHRWGGGGSFQRHHKNVTLDYMSAAVPMTSGKDPPRRGRHINPPSTRRAPPPCPQILRLHAQTSRCQWDLSCRSFLDADEIHVCGGWINPIFFCIKYPDVSVPPGKIATAASDSGGQVGLVRGFAYLHQTCFAIQYCFTVLKD